MHCVDGDQYDSVQTSGIPTSFAPYTTVYPRPKPNYCNLYPILNKIRIFSICSIDSVEFAFENMSNV